MNFRDLKLPKELSKKKKLELYKCYILSPLKKGDAIRTLELDIDDSRYGLTEAAAINYAVNNKGIKFASNVDEVKSAIFVIMKITLLAGVMDEEILLAPGKDNSNTSLYGINSIDPSYEPSFGLLNVTIRDRIDYAETNIKNYAYESGTLRLDPNTNIIDTSELQLREMIINKAVTGG